MRLRITLLTLICTNLISIVMTPVLAGEPSIEDLMGMAPVIQSSDERIQSIELGGYWKDDNGNTMLRFCSLYRAPGKHALLIMDGTDGTPLSFASDRKLMVYDPINGYILYSSKDSSAKTWIRLENNIFTFSWPISIDSEKSSSINLDIKSMLEGSSKSVDMTKTGEGKYRLTRTSNGGNFYIFHIDTSMKQPFQKVELVMGNTGKVRFCVDKIVVDGLLGDEVFEFPTKERLAEKIQVKEWSNEGILQAIEGLGSFTRTFYVRAAANLPEYRDSPNLINLFGLAKIDWEEIKKNDKKYSQALKDLHLTKPRLP